MENRCLLSDGFLLTNLVADTPGVAAITDPKLINPWGIASGPGGPFWVSDNHGGVSTLYGATGQPQPAGSPLVVTIPLPAASPPGAIAAPTGTVFNDGPGFVVSENGVSGPSQFLFATEDGTILGWNPSVDPTHAILAVDNSANLLGGAGAVYKGLASGSNASGTFLYATDFRAGVIDVFDQNFHTVHLSGSFTDPAMPAGFAPFGIQNLGGSLFVTFAKQDAGYDAVPGPGNGLVDVFDTSGHFLRRIASQGLLNVPWGLALAPDQFGAFSHDLLVGNFGDGRIDAFDPASGSFLGSLEDGNGQAVTIPGLWGLSFGAGGSGGDPNTLWFTAGPGNEQHGLFGELQDTADVARGADAGGGQGPGVYNLLLGDRSERASPRNGQPNPVDDYPLPPASGPALRGEIGPRPGLFPVLLPLKDPPLAMASTSPTSSQDTPERIATPGPGDRFGGTASGGNGPVIPAPGPVLTPAPKLGPPAIGAETGLEEAVRQSHLLPSELVLNLSAHLDSMEQASDGRSLGSSPASPVPGGLWMMADGDPGRFTPLENATLPSAGQGAGADFLVSEGTEQPLGPTGIGENRHETLAELGMPVEQGTAMAAGGPAAGTDSPCGPALSPEASSRGAAAGSGAGSGAGSPGHLVKGTLVVFVGLSTASALFAWRHGYVSRRALRNEAIRLCSLESGSRFRGWISGLRWMG